MAVSPLVSVIMGISLYEFFGKFIKGNKIVLFTAIVVTRVYMTAVYFVPFFRPVALVLPAILFIFFTATETVGVWFAILFGVLFYLIIGIKNLLLILCKRQRNIKLMLRMVLRIKAEKLLKILSESHNLTNSLIQCLVSFGKVTAIELQEEIFQISLQVHADS